MTDSSVVASRRRLWIFDAAAGVALLSGAVAPWLRTGPGHTLRGLDLADQLLAGQLSPSWGRTVGLALYVCVGAGALLVASSAFRNLALDLVRFGVSAAILGSAVFVVVLSWFPLELWGLAPAMAVLGLVLCCASNGWSVSRRLHPIAQS